MARIAFGLLFCMIWLAASVVQAKPQFEVRPDSQTVSSAAGTTSFGVESDVEWTVTDISKWLTATKTDGSTISVTYQANTSSSRRTAIITASGTGGFEKTVMVIQKGVGEFEITDFGGSPSSGFTTRWSCSLGYEYQVEWASTLNPKNWTPIGLVLKPRLGQTTMSFTDKTTDGATRRFYRVEQSIGRLEK